MRCRIYVPGLWHLSVIPSFSGYCVRNVVAVLILLACLLIIFLTISDTHAVWRKQQQLDDLHVSMATADAAAAAVAMATDVTNPLLNYGVVVDCGSSGSRVFVYYWPPHDGNANELLHIQPVRDQEAKAVVKKIEPGISDFANRPSEASQYLKPLLQYAADHIPESKHKETPLYIMATAGMRMLEQIDQEAILNDLRVDIPIDFDFLFTETQAEVIPGKQEGVYSWVAINFALGKFDHTVGEDPLSIVEVPGSEGKTHIRKRTVGILDMGGGSLQIAFEVPKSVRFELPKEEVAKSMLAEFNLGCSRQDLDHQYRVYVATFLGIGGNTIRKDYERHLVVSVAGSLNDSVSTVGLTPDTAIPDPCLPLEMPDKASIQGRTYYVVGTGDFPACQERLRPYLNHSGPCVKEPCSIQGAYQPTISTHGTEFYGFAEFFYTMEDILHIGGKYDSAKFKRAAQDYCSTRWSTISDWRQKGLHPRADTNRYRLQCFKSAWLSVVLHEGVNFPHNYKALTTLQYINGQEVHWTLGALLYKTRYFPLREIEKQTRRHYKPPWMVEELSHAHSLLVLCIVVVVMAICLYLRRLRVVTGAGLRRVPTMKYFMTEEGQMEDGLLVDRVNQLHYSMAGSTGHSNTGGFQFGGRLI